MAAIGFMYVCVADALSSPSSQISGSMYAPCVQKFSYDCGSTLAVLCILSEANTGPTSNKSTFWYITETHFRSKALSFSL